MCFCRKMNKKLIIIERKMLLRKKWVTVNQYIDNLILFVKWLIENYEIDNWSQVTDKEVNIYLLTFPEKRRTILKGYYLIF